jgi:hypothetical protein
VVIDGAPDLREHLLTRSPFATHVTDFFHVVEHISDAHRLLLPDDQKSREAQRRSFCQRSHIAARRGHTVPAVSADHMLKGLRHARLDNSPSHELKKLVAIGLLLARPRFRWRPHEQSGRGCCEASP